MVIFEQFIDGYDCYAGLFELISWSPPSPQDAKLMHRIPDSINPRNQDAAGCQLPSPTFSLLIM